MANMLPGRYTAQIDEPFVVCLIGMRVNKLTHLPQTKGDFSVSGDY